MKHKISEQIWTKNFVFLFFTNFFLFIVHYAFITALPIYVLDELKGTEAQAGLVVTMLLISAIIVRPFSGKILECLVEYRSGHGTATFLTFFDIGIAGGAYVLGIIVTHFSFSGLYLFAGIVSLLMLVLFRPLYNRSQALVEESLTIEQP